MKRIILAPRQGEQAYALAAKAFRDMYLAVTGITLDIVYEDDGVSDLFVIGSDAVNDFLVDRLIFGQIKSLGIRYGTEDYCIHSEKDGDRDILILAGGRGRSTLYAVYDYFERIAGCHYFWDGDVIPHKNSLSLSGLNINESPRFMYRGLRYFAHRGLKRFQAEHWGLEDWKKEIDWLVKKRLNFFMLRIGMDDLWQRVFPDEVAYPSHNETNPDKHGYLDRTIFWPLEYRGVLRQKLLKYAADCDLIHPEDCGTMTHWYSPTPKDFLKNHRPPVKIMGQAVMYNYVPETQVWDIRDEESMDNYMKLTEGYVKEFNPGANIFHTIGLAERFMLDDRAASMNLKRFAYRRIMQNLRERFPHSKLLVATWDFVWWKADEVEQLVSELDPERTIIFDYTSDIDDPEQSFLKWNISGKFPYIFGLFHAYEPESSLRGPYERYDERLRVAANDPMCQGMVLWPELSHSDPLVLEYLTENAWNPLTMTIEQLTKRFCDRRYGDMAETMNDIWQTALPVIKLCDWGGYTERDEDDPDKYKYLIDCDAHREMWFDYRNFRGEKTLHHIRHYKYRIEQFEENFAYFTDTLEGLSHLTNSAWDNTFILRDAVDLARTVIGRYMNILIMKAKVLENEANLENIRPIKELFMKLMQYLIKLLSQNDDFSLYHSLIKLSEVCSVNKNFEHTIKGNLIEPYCRQYCYEAMKYLYAEECGLAFDEIMMSDKTDLSAEYKKAEEAFMSTPLESMKPCEAISLPELLQEVSQCIKEKAGL